MTKEAYIIDDDRIYQYSFEKILSIVDAEIDCRIFQNGEEAYQHCKNLINSQGSFPQIIFLDLNMPVMDGWDFLDELATLDEKLLEHTNIYIVSSSIDEYDINKAKEYKMVEDYLVKPVSKAKLEELIALNF